MTRDQQLKTALQVLAPPRDRREECVKGIVDALNTIQSVTEHRTANRNWASKGTKDKIKIFLAKLKALQAALNNLPPPYQGLALRGVDLKEEIAACERWRAPSFGKPKRTANKQHLAAFEARELLQRYGHPITTTKTGQWCKLSAILFGDPSANLFHSCCHVKNNPNAVYHLRMRIDYSQSPPPD
jgi:hypothetical protein